MAGLVPQQVNPSASCACRLADGDGHGCAEWWHQALSKQVTAGRGNPARCAWLCVPGPHLLHQCASPHVPRLERCRAAPWTLWGAAAACWWWVGGARRARRAAAGAATSACGTPWPLRPAAAWGGCPATRCVGNRARAHAVPALLGLLRSACLSPCLPLPLWCVSIPAFGCPNAHAGNSDGCVHAAGGLAAGGGRRRWRADLHRPSHDGRQ